jgi:hypothetical protein
VIDRLCERLRATALSRRPERALVLGIDRDPLAKVTLLLFDAAGVLCAVAKVARDPASEASLEREFAALCRLELTDGRLPRPLMLDRVCGRLVLATTALEGSPMTVAYYTPGHVRDREAVRRDFVLAGRWLAQFQRDTAGEQVRLGDELWHQQLAPLMEKYLRGLKSTEGTEGTDGGAAWAAQQAACTDLAAAARRLPPTPIHTGVVHGDFAIGNVLTERGSIAGVIDWELSRPSGLPMFDVLKFAASYSSFLDRAAPPRGGAMPGHPGWAEASSRWPSPSGWSNLTGFLYGFRGTGWYPDLVRDFVGHHADRLGVPTKAVPVLLRAFVAEQSTVLSNCTYARGYQELFLALHELVGSDQPVGGRS